MSYDPTLSYKTRHKHLQRMRSDVFDLVIIGGGINGAGVARDAALRGMSVALIETRDFAEGTSSRSSKLIHGGIRYLENMEFGLVFEALRERQALFDMAPHLVHPLRFLIPLYRGGRVGMWKMSLGMWLYDALSLFEAPEPHDQLTKQQCLELAPQLRKQDLLGGFTYFDAYMDDDRLVLETLRSAHSAGAIMANYVSAEEAEMNAQGQVMAVLARDQLTHEPLRICARHVVSTVGPWTDRLGIKFFKQWKRRLRPSKGVHLVFSQDDFHLKDAVVMAAESRIVFAIPRGDRVILGTTDTDFPDDPARVRVEKSDVDYLISVASHYFPGAKLDASHVISSYAGVRPLVDDGAADESQTSREHWIFSDPSRVTFVAGGKYTTYRSMAAEAVDQVLAYNPELQAVITASAPSMEPLNPLVTKDRYQEAQVESEEWGRLWGLDQQVTKGLAIRHGLEGRRILQQFAHQVGSSRDPMEKLWRLELHHAIHSTMCMTLKDFFFRRSPLYLFDALHGATYVSALSEDIANLLGLSLAEKEVQVHELKKALESGWRSE